MIFVVGRVKKIKNNACQNKLNNRKRRVYTFPTYVDINSIPLYISQTPRQPHKADTPKKQKQPQIYLTLTQTSNLIWIVLLRAII
jgi:hypothetical protein